MKKQIISIIMAFAILGTMCSCKKLVAVETSSDYYVSVAGQSNTNSTDSNGQTSGATSGVTSGVTSSTTSGTAKPNGTINKDFSVKEGKTPIEQGLNFGGKTFIMAIPYTPSDAVKAKIAAFEKKYNLKINLKIFSFNSYSNQVAALMNSGTSVDVGNMHGSMFPNAVIANLYEPLDDIITTADLCNTSNPDAGGIDLEKSKYFAWNNYLYGTCGYYATQPMMIYYNKKMVSDYGFEDLRSLYEKGAWTWDKLKEIGSTVLKGSGKKIYFGSMEYYSGWAVPANGGEYVTYKNNKPVENLTNERVIHALQFVQSICTGENAIIKNKGSQQDSSSFFSGETFSFAGGTNAYEKFSDSAKSSNAFGKKAENLGMVPMPLGPDNKEKKYPTDYLSCDTAGKGTSDRRVAVAWTKFCATYDSNEGKKYIMSDADKKLFNGLMGNIISSNNGFSSSSESVNNIVSEIESKVYLGYNITEILENNRTRVQSCIDTALLQQR